jgi:hypothetical protein
MIKGLSCCPAEKVFQPDSGCSYEQQKKSRPMVGVLQVNNENAKMLCMGIFT